MNRMSQLASQQPLQTQRLLTAMMRYEFHMAKASVYLLKTTLRGCVFFCCCLLKTMCKSVCGVFIQWTVGGTKVKKKVKQVKGPEKKNVAKKKVNKAAASGSSDGDSSAESSAPEEGEYSPDSQS